MRKLMLISIVPILFCVNVLAQDVLLYYDGEAVLTEVLRVDEEYVYHRGITGNEQTPLGIVDVLLTENHPLRRPWSFSLGLGFTGVGTAGSWDALLSRHAFDADVASWFGGTINYPKKDLGIEMDLGLDYRYHAHKGWGWKLQWFNSGSIRGYDQSAYNFGQLEIPFSQRSVLVYHRWYLATDSGTNFYLGPSLHQVSYAYEGRLYDPSPSYERTRMGATGGLQLGIMERQKAFVRLGLEFALVPPLQTEPFRMSGVIYHEDGPVRGYYTALPADDIRLSAFSVRLVYGFKK